MAAVWGQQACFPVVLDLQPAVVCVLLVCGVFQCRDSSLSMKFGILLLCLLGERGAFYVVLQNPRLGHHSIHFLNC